MFLYMFYMKLPENEYRYIPEVVSEALNVKPFSNTGIDEAKIISLVMQIDKIKFEIYILKL